MAVKQVVIDAGNGATSEAAPLMFEELGCEVTPLYCEFDGNFPNHQPDPSRSENLQDLIAKVAEVGADLGVAFDGDGDRLTIVTAKGRIIWPDQLLMLFARDILASNPGTDVLFDVKSTRLLNQVISGAGGRPIMWKTGHSFMKQKMSNISDILTQARGIQINNPDGSISFKIVDVQPGGIFAHLGIENNDVITQINGQQISDLNAVMSLFGKMTKINKLNLMIKRNGSQLPLDYKFR